MGLMSAAVRGHASFTSGWRRKDWEHDHLRGSMVAVYSLLKHTSCPKSIFNFLAAAGGGAEGVELELLRRAVAVLRSTRSAPTPRRASSRRSCAPCSRCHSTSRGTTWWSCSRTTVVAWETRSV
jgi:hypothetical protein